MNDHERLASGSKPEIEKCSYVGTEISSLFYCRNAGNAKTLPNTPRRAFSFVQDQHLSLLRSSIWLGAEGCDLGSPVP